MTNHKRISELLKDCGVPTNVKGYRYLKEAIEIGLDDFACVEHITKELYPEIAKKFNTTASRVERAIRHAIELAFSRGNYGTLEEIFGSTIDLRKDKATNKHFITMLIERFWLDLEDEAVAMARQAV